MNEIERPEMIKTTSPMTGEKRAAILFTELGSSVTDSMLPLFTNRELHRLRKAVKNMGPYNVRDDIIVLQRALAYGASKGLVPQNVPTDSSVKQRSSELRSAANNDPSSMASLIRSWISEDEKGKNPER
jgi:hypothetical protein